MRGSGVQDHPWKFTEVEASPVLHLDPVLFGLLITLQRPLWYLRTQRKRKPFFYAISQELERKLVSRELYHKSAHDDTNFKTFSSVLSSSLIQYYKIDNF